MALAVVWPMPYTYCSEYSMYFWLGTSTPAIRAARMTSRRGCVSVWAGGSGAGIP